MMYSCVSNTRPGSLKFFYMKMTNFLDFYEVTVPPVLSNGVAYSIRSCIGDARVLPPGKLVARR